MLVTAETGSHWVPFSNSYLSPDHTQNTWSMGPLPVVSESAPNLVTTSANCLIHQGVGRSFQSLAPFPLGPM